MFKKKDVVKNVTMPQKKAIEKMWMRYYWKLNECQEQSAGYNSPKHNGVLLMFAVCMGYVSPSMLEWSLLPSISSCFAMTITSQMLVFGPGYLFFSQVFE